MAIEIYLGAMGSMSRPADGGVSGLRALDGASFDLMVVGIFMLHMPGSSRSGCSTRERHRSR
jgi:hypothetical protein